MQVGMVVVVIKMTLHCRLYQLLRIVKTYITTLIRSSEALHDEYYFYSGRSVPSCQPWESTHDGRKK